MGRTRIGWGAVLAMAVSCALLALATPAHAQSTQPTPDASGAPSALPPPEAPATDLTAQAAERKKAGDQAMEALRYADALAAYGDAFTITQDPALLYNMGRALQALGRFPEALDKLEAFDSTASADLKGRVPRLGQLIADLKQRVTKLVVTTNVAGARILVRNTVVGKSPLPGPVRLIAGPAEIEVEAEGYFTGKRSVVLPGGSSLDVAVDLFSRATTGLLTVRASSAGAEVLVDGRRVGNAPVESNVPQGSHKILVRHPDYRVFETEVVVPPGGNKTVTAALQSKSVVTKWWFWGGVGAVVATGVVIAIAASTERSPDSGTIAPGPLSRPAFRF